MANKKSVITMPQIERFKPATTARWLRTYLYTEGTPQAVANYLAHLRLVQLLYDFLETDHELDPLDYHQELTTIYQQETWQPDLMRHFLHLQSAFLPFQWARLWKKFYRLTREKLLAQVSPQKQIALQALDQLATTVLGSGFVKAQVIPLTTSPKASS